MTRVRKEEDREDSASQDGDANKTCQLCRSGKSAEIISAKRRADDVFAFEYILSLPNGMKVHTWSLAALQNPGAAAAVAARAGLPFDGSAQLFTMTLVAPEGNRSDLKPEIVDGILSGFRLL